LNRAVPKYPNYSTLSRNLFSIFMLCFCTAFCSRHGHILVTQTFAFGPILLLATIQLLFFFTVRIFSTQ